jgi:hypothetical protein
MKIKKTNKQRKKKDVTREADCCQESQGKRYGTCGLSLFLSLSRSSLEDEGFQGNMCWFACALFGLIN